jgi:hypothetical protein
MHALQRFAQRLAVQRLGQAGYVGVAGGGKQRHGAFVDAFEQQDPDLVLRERQACVHFKLLKAYPRQVAVFSEGNMRLDK